MTGVRGVERGHDRSRPTGGPDGEVAGGSSVGDGDGEYNADGIGRGRLSHVEVETGTGGKCSGSSEADTSIGNT